MKKIDVKLRHTKTDIMKVGSLASEGQKLYFEYGRDFLTSIFDLSPFMLPKQSGVLTLKTPSHLQGLWGVFQDGLPDSWGWLLMDRYFRSRRIDLPSLSLLDRLLFIGERGAGALSYHLSLEIEKNNN
ncbi:MAG: HipA N-terminal domain-containing protein, partial [Pseudomonadota bacterium]